MLSFWELRSLMEFDHIIVGSGLVGLSTAISLKEKQADLNILVLERGTLPTGASTKNAGFACFGSVSELLSDLTRMSEEEVKELVETRLNGLQLLRLRLGEEEIGYQQRGGYELVFEGEENIVAEMGRINQLLKPLFGENVFEQSDDKIEAFGFNQEKVKHLIRNKLEGQLDTGLMMKMLWTEAQNKGIRVLTGSKVTGYNDKGNNGVEVNVVNEDVNEKMTFNSKKLIICTNAFTKELIPDVALKPGRGQVLVTQPIEGLKFKGVFHYDEGYYYFRNFGDRIIFGGGRNLDFEREKTTNIETTDEIMAILEEHLKTIILPDQAFVIDHKWAGIMAFGENKKPIVKNISPNVFAGVRLGGMGVAIGSKLGEQLADLVLSENPE